MKNLLISLLITGAVIGGTIAAVTFYNKAQQRDLAAGVLTAVQRGDINAVYDACQKLVNAMSARSGNYTGIWAGCDSQGNPVCHDVANGSGCNPATRPFCGGYPSLNLPASPIPTTPVITIPEFTPASPNQIQ